MRVIGMNDILRRQADDVLRILTGAGFEREEIFLEVRAVLTEPASHGHGTIAGRLTTSEIAALVSRRILRLRERRSES